MEQYDTPIAVIIFNRAETTLQVLDAIRKVKPKKLYVIADGPRKNHPEDEKNCRETRAVFDQVDWNCEIFKKFSVENFGCGKSPSNGISWVFEQEEECIILEDDCVPHISFFRFCQELLKKYRNDKRIMMISGNDHRLKVSENKKSYFFSRHTQTWGWATWKRAWNYYDYEMKLWPEVRESKWLYQIMQDHRTAKYWTKLFDRCHQDKNKDYWDFQWTFCCLAQNALNIIPEHNLVSNIGFGEMGGTHFIGSAAPFANLPVSEMPFPLQHPATMTQDIKSDYQINKSVYGVGSLPIKVWRKLLQIKNSMLS